MRAPVDSLKYLVFTVGILLLIVAPSCAQDYRYGQPSDLRGLKKVFIETKGDTKIRDKIISELEKSRLGFVIVNDDRQTEILLLFLTSERDGDPIVIPNQSRPGQTVINPVYVVGNGMVVVPSREDKPLLILWTNHEQQSRLQHNPVNGFIRDFLKAYKKGNEIK